MPSLLTIFHACDLPIVFRMLHFGANSSDRSFNHRLRHHRCNHRRRLYRKGRARLRLTTVAVATTDNPETFTVVKATDIDHLPALRCRRSPRPTRVGSLSPPASLFPAQFRSPSPSPLPWTHWPCSHRLISNPAAVGYIAVAGIVSGHLACDDTSDLARLPDPTRTIYPTDPDRVGTTWIRPFQLRFKPFLNGSMYNSRYPTVLRMHVT